MATNLSAELFEFANFQMAAEAFLQNAVLETDPAILQALLVQGNQRASRFPEILAENFANKWIVAAHQEDTSTGFSGTLFRSRQPDANNKYEYTLSFRSTEFVDDAIQDATGANDLEIRQIGWALGQISDMDAWYRELLTAGEQDPDKGLPPDAHYNVTGYSLGGHLVSAFLLLRDHDKKVALVDHAYTFNGAGTGGIRPGQQFDAILASFNEIGRAHV